LILLGKIAVIPVPGLGRFLGMALSCPLAAASCGEEGLALRTKRVLNGFEEISPVIVGTSIPGRPCPDPPILGGWHLYGFWRQMLFAYGLAQNEVGKSLI